MGDSILGIGPDGPRIPVTDVRLDATWYVSARPVPDRWPVGINPADYKTISVSVLVIPDPANAITYSEYWTGPTPWWKRAWRRLARTS